MFILALFLTVDAGVENGLEFEDVDAAATSALENASMHVNNITLEFNNTILDNSLKPFIQISLKYTMEVFRIGTVLAMDVYEEYPEYINPKTLMTLFILFLISPLIIPFVKLIIIIVILCNEWRLSRKEKRKKQRKDDSHNTIKKEAQQPNGKIE